ncbi:MAG: DUF4136 domain-containing protein [Vicinamibacterales bacterium]
MRVAAAMLGLLLTSVALSADDHAVLFDDHVDFSRLKTFSLSTPGVTTTRPELTSPVLASKLAAGLRTALAAAGMKELDQNADATVGYTLNATDFGIGPFGRAHALTPGRRGPAGALPVDYTDVTLVVDISDRPGGTLLWRGVYHDTETKAGKFAEVLPKDLAKLFEKFPPRRK